MQRLVKQRNASLKTGLSYKKEIKIWDTDFIKTSYAIDELRQMYVKQFVSLLLELLDELLDIKKLTFFLLWLGHREGRRRAS